MSEVTLSRLCGYSRCSRWRPFAFTGELKYRTEDAQRLYRNWLINYYDLVTCPWSFAYGRINTVVNNNNNNNNNNFRRWSTNIHFDLFVRPSRSRVNISSKIISPSGSHTILVFPYQTLWQYSDEELLIGASNAGVVVSIAFRQNTTKNITWCRCLSTAVGFPSVLLVYGCTTGSRWQPSVTSSWRHSATESAHSDFLAPGTAASKVCEFDT